MPRNEDCDYPSHFIVRVEQYSRDELWVANWYEQWVFIKCNNPSDSGAVTRVVLYLLVLSSSCVSSQFSGCDFSENLRVGDTRDIFSPGFPNPYRGQVNCRWTATAPVGTTLQFQCTDVNLPVVSYASIIQCCKNAGVDTDLSLAEFKLR